MALVVVVVVQDTAVRSHQALQATVGVIGAQRVCPIGALDLDGDLEHLTRSVEVANLEDSLQRARDPAAVH